MTRSELIEDAAARVVLGQLHVNEQPRDLASAVAERDYALHELAHLLELPCPLCEDGVRPVQDTLPL